MESNTGGLGLLETKTYPDFIYLYFHPMAQFPVSNSTLSAPHLAQFVGQQYLLDKAACRIIKAGVNDTYKITTASEQFVLRVYSCNWRSKTGISEELRLIKHLADSGISVSQPLPDKDGKLVQELDAPEGLRYAVLFSYAKGEKRHNYSAELHHEAGVLMAQMHNATENYGLDRVHYTASSLFTDPFELIKTFLPGGEEMDFMKKAEQYLLHEFSKFKTAELRYGAVHMDIWFDNMNIDSHDKITLFDFDFCGNGWLCLDVAYYTLQFVERDENECKQKTESFLQGYGSVTSLSAEERRLLPTLGLAMYFFYLGVQCSRFDNWSNVFLNETYLKRYVTAVVKRFADINGIKV